MMVFLNGRWHSLKETSANNSKKKALQFSKPITDGEAAWLRLWYTENLDTVGEIKQKPDSLKILPFAGHEFGVYRGCYMEQVGHRNSMHLWRIFFEEREVQKM